MASVPIPAADLKFGLDEVGHDDLGQGEDGKALGSAAACHRRGRGLDRKPDFNRTRHI